MKYKIVVFGTKQSTISLLDVIKHDVDLIVTIDNTTSHHISGKGDVGHYAEIEDINCYSTSDYSLKSCQDFFENNDKKLEINIKHSAYDPRPLSMGSGAEKTLASMAIRLALISITNLPKSELFILDEPATALDQDHMEGFTNLLRLIKNQFKTVILISHLDSLKDVVDKTIDITKINGYANVRI